MSAAVHILAATPPHKRMPSPGDAGQLSGGGGGGEAKLYRASHGTFEDYCRERWGFARNYANKMIAASSVVSNLGTTVPIPESERQARPLAKLPAEEQAHPCPPPAAPAAGFF